MKIEVRIRIRPFRAIMRARIARPRLESPRVSDRKIGVLPIGLTIGNKAPTTRSVYFARSLRAPGMIATVHDRGAELCWFSGKWSAGESIDIPVATIAVA